MAPVSVIIVSVGGGLGAIAREGAILLFGRYSAAFPVDIFAANSLSCLLLGLIFGLHQKRRVSDQVALLVSTGFCGGMSTFSTFIYGAYSELGTPGHLALSVLYIMVSLVVGYCMTWAGLHLAMKMRGPSDEILGD